MHALVSGKARMAARPLFAWGGVFLSPDGAVLVCAKRAVQLCGIIEIMKPSSVASTDAPPFGEGPWSKFRLLVVVLIIWGWLVTF
jgi:hypothetical protein